MPLRASHLLVALALYVVAWMLVTIVLPRSPSTDASALLPGAVLVGSTVAGLQLVSQLYLPGRFDRASELYGAVGTTIVVLGWFFIIGRMVMVSMSGERGDLRALRQHLAVRVLAPRAAAAASAASRSCASRSDWRTTLPRRKNRA